MNATRVVYFTLTGLDLTVGTIITKITNANVLLVMSTISFRYRNCKKRGKQECLLNQHQLERNGHTATIVVGRALVVVVH
jgi:hypothetical protein